MPRSFVGIAIYLLALGFRDVDLSVVAPFRYSYLLTSAIGGYLVFREVPDVWTVVGAGSDRGQRHLYAASRGRAAPLAHRHGDSRRPRPETDQSGRAFDQVSIDGPWTIGLATPVLCRCGGRSVHRANCGRPANRPGGIALEGLAEDQRRDRRPERKIRVHRQLSRAVRRLISAGNAGSRYLFSESSNGWLEIQWYMFAGMVLLGAPYTLKMNEHVRVDLVYGMVSERTRIWIDIIGGFLFLLPICIILTYFTWPWFVDSWKLNEASSNAGGLVRWPVKLLLPVGFCLMALQGVSEIIKRIAALEHVIDIEFKYEKPLQ